MNNTNRLYRIWNNMRTRCNKSYCDHFDRYGGRGIKVCKEWDNLNDGYKNFESWALSNGYSENLTIDRIDNDGNYEPANCRWVSRKVQSRNKEISKRITYNGEKMQINDFAEKYGLTVSAVSKRIKNGWSIEKIVQTPIKHVSRTVLYMGKQVTLRELSELTGVNYNTICTRYQRGATVLELISADKKSDKLKKSILKIDKTTGTVIGKYRGSSDAVKSVNGKAKSRIIECCNGTAKTAYGYKWSYE